MQTPSDSFYLSDTDESVAGRAARRWVRGYVLFLLLWTAAGVGCLACGVWKGQGSPAFVLLDRINPNTASAGSLIRLEGIGRVRAQAIVAYRQANVASGQVVFAAPQDLEAVYGIGPKTVEKMTPYLDFDCDEEIFLQEP